MNVTFDTFGLFIEVQLLASCLTFFELLILVNGFIASMASLVPTNGMEAWFCTKFWISKDHIKFGKLDFIRFRCLIHPMFLPKSVAIMAFFSQ